MSNMDDLNFDDIDIDDDSGNGFDGDFGDMFGDDGTFNDTTGGDPNNTQGMPNDQNYFDGNLDDDVDDITDDQRSVLSKKYIIIAACGIVFTLLVLIIGGRVIGGRKNNNNALSNIESQQPVYNENTNINVDDVMGGGNRQQVQSPTQNNQDVNVNYHKDENEFSWMEITDSENVVFESEYAERIFTITTVKHYARTVDSASNLVIKTTLSGSISGLPGTYTIEVPYSKGVKLKSGNSFTINVLLGTYNDKIVVGDITY